MVTVRRPVQPLQFMLDGQLVPVVRDDERGDRAGELLDELDTLVTELDAALAAAGRSEAELAAAERKARVTQARIALVQAALAAELARKEVDA